MIELMIATPTGLWANIINAFVSFVFNYAWAIILLTICIKLILSPLDFMNKKVSRDNAKMQSVIAPQMAKLQKQYGHDRNLLNQKTQELYKANGFNLGGSCVVMLVYLVITMVIFISLFTSLNKMAVYNTEKEYLELRNAYNIAYELETGDDTAKHQAGEQAVLEKYDARNSTFLWIKNVWVADSPFKTAVLDFDSYLKQVGNNVKRDIADETSQSLKALKKEDPATYETYIAEFRTEYENTMNVVLDKRNGPNGFFITAVLAVATAFFSQWLMQRKMSAKANAGAPAGMQTKTGGNKIMLILLPAIMGLITLFYNAVFGLYIIAGQLVSMITFPLIDKLLDKYYEKKDKERDEKIKMDYRR